MPHDAFRDAYAKAVFPATKADQSLDKTGGNNDRSKSRLAAALDRAHEIRKFEIELYWKRANHFWLFQTSIFIAFAYLAKESHRGAMPTALSALGLLTAVAGYWSAKGSSFWQKNWEKHIDMLEDDVEGRLHKTVWVEDGAFERSVSRLNSVLGQCFIAFWFGVLLTSSAHVLPSPQTAIMSDVGLGLLKLAVIWLFAIAGIAALYRQVSRLAGLPVAPSGTFKKSIPARDFKLDFLLRRPNPFQDNSELESRAD